MKRSLMFGKKIDWTTVQLYDILCTDWTFISPDKFTASGKKGIGVVYWINSDKSAKVGNRIRITSIDVYTKKAWSTEHVEVPNLINIPGTNVPAIEDWDGRGNTDKVLSYSGYSDSKYPSFAICNEYYTNGTKPGDWYLGAICEIDLAYRERLSGVNNSIFKCGGTQIKSMLDNYWYEYIRTSSQYNSSYAWMLIVYSNTLFSGIGNGSSYTKNMEYALNNNFTVRPMLII